MLEPGSNDGSLMARFSEVKMGGRDIKRGKEKRVPTLAELSLPQEELKRLSILGMGMKKNLKIGKAGITEGIVNGIHERWRRSEVVKIVCEDISKMNMKRTHDLLEVCFPVLEFHLFVSLFFFDSLVSFSTNSSSENLAQANVLSNYLIF